LFSLLPSHRLASASHRAQTITQSRSGIPRQGSACRHYKAIAARFSRLPSHRMVATFLLMLGVLK
jgi:hypothetical protein